MSTPIQEQRFEFALELSQRIQDAQSKTETYLQALSAGENNRSGHFDTDAESAGSPDSEKMRQKIARYEEMVQSVRTIHEQMTAQVGEWLGFIHDMDNRRHILFPIRLLMKKSRTQRALKEGRAEIAAIGLKSRLLMDEISRLEYSLRTEAVRRNQSGLEWDTYQNALNEKKEGMNHLVCLLPTLFPNEKIALDPCNMQPLIRRLKFALTK